MQTRRSKGTIQIYIYTHISNLSIRIVFNLLSFMLFKLSSKCETSKFPQFPILWPLPANYICLGTSVLSFAPCSLHLFITYKSHYQYVTVVLQSTSFSSYLAALWHSKESAGCCLPLCYQPYPSISSVTENRCFTSYLLK